jgi:hypothetical protein
MNRNTARELKRHNDHYQLVKVLEHWGMSLILLCSVIVCNVFLFFMNLSGILWICFLAASFGFMVSGGGLIAYAKYPAYRSGQFFTFGGNSVPGHLTGFYRWGWRLFLLGVVLSFCLFLSKP